MRLEGRRASVGRTAHGVVLVSVSCGGGKRRRAFVSGSRGRGAAATGHHGIFGETELLSVMLAWERVERDESQCNAGWLWSLGGVDCLCAATLWTKRPSIRWRGSQGMALGVSIYYRRRMEGATGDDEGGEGVQAGVGCEIVVVNGGRKKSREIRRGQRGTGTACPMGQLQARPAALQP